MIWFIKEGHFTPLIRGIFTALGIAIGIFGLKYMDSLWVALLGLLLAAIGGYSSRAAMLKIKPFDNSYKRTRDSYKSKDDSEDK